MGLVRDLCTYQTGVVADANEALFQRIAEEVPLRIHRFASGSTFNGWLVPENWRVRRATISRNGRVVFDGSAHPLAVAQYSRSFEGELEWEEFRSHIVTSEAVPEATVYHCLWQYRPWAADWAFSVPYEIFKTWEAGSYHVTLETEYSPGEMLVGEALHKGRSQETIVFNAHTCHPHMANDGFSGVATLIRLFQWLSTQSTHYSYRLILGPEHLGTIFYLRDRTRGELEKLVSGFFVEMTGTPFPHKAASTFLGNQMIDAAFRNALRHRGEPYELVPWRRGAGNDETVWEAPGCEVPFVELTRCRDLFDPYREYHTDLDTPDSLDARAVEETFDLLKDVIMILENNSVASRKFNGLICLSNPQYDLYRERPDPAINWQCDDAKEKWGRLQDSLMRYFDGSMSILEIAEKHELPFGPLLDYLKRFEEKGLIRLEFLPIRRAPIS